MDIYQIFVTYNHIWSVKEIFIALLIIAVTITISLLLYCKKRMKFSQAIAIPILTAFLLIVFGSTVFGRMPGIRRCELMPLWSYGAIIRGNTGILQEVLLNCVLLFPVGMLLPLVFNDI